MFNYFGSIDILNNGPNLIEQTPDILDRFHRYPIGLSTDFEKAFLQLGITPKHREFLRFFYPDEGEKIVHRHCRVVFGVSSSSFLLAAVLVHLLENVSADDTQLGSMLKLSFYVDNCVKEQVTIPRLELMACYIGARLAHSLQESLNITKMETVFWSDSMVALYWLREKGGWFLFEIPIADTKDLDVRDANHYRKRLRFRAKVIEELKKRFRDEYLGQLIQRQKQHTQLSNIQVGDIVLIGDD
ncbi:integrase catalytic domain-containing protein [Trichonephila clavipes]|nr:integrase catalytic domain-containing protein [Trichonephila clavipes]